MRSLVLASLISVAPLAAVAQDGWEMIRLSELADTPQYRFRENGSDFLRTRGDYDGDGREDSAQLARNPEAGTYAVMVGFATGEISIIAEGPLEALPSMAISSVGPGLYLTVCAEGDTDCGPRNVDIATDAISLFEFEGANRYLYWQDGELHEIRMAN